MTSLRNKTKAKVVTNANVLGDNASCFGRGRHATAVIAKLNDGKAFPLRSIAKHKMAFDFPAIFCRITFFGLHFYSFF